MKITIKKIFKILVGSMIGLAFLAACVAGLFFYVLSHRPDLNERDRAFISAIMKDLPQQGDWELVSKIHQGEWDMVCIFNDYLLPRDRIIHGFLGIEASKVEFINRKPIASDSEWSVIFFYPPNKLESFMIPDRYITYHPSSQNDGKPCRHAEEAVFQFSRSLGWDWPGISLTTINLTREGTE